MIYLFLGAVILFFVLARLRLKLYPGLALLLAGAIASLVIRGEEPWFRWFFALGSVTDLLLRMAFGALIVEFLIRRQVFHRVVAAIENKVGVGYFGKLLVTLVLAVPGMISGSFLVGQQVVTSLWDKREQNIGFVRAALLLGVLAPPFNPYLELIVLGRGIPLAFNWTYLVFLLIPLWLVVPFLFSSELPSSKPVTGKSRLFHLSLWPILLYLLWEILIRPLAPGIGVSPMVLVSLLVMWLSLVQIKRLFADLESALRVVLPTIVFFLAAGFVASLAASGGYRGAMVLNLLELTSAAKMWFLLVGGLLVGAISPVLAIILVGIPLVTAGAGSSPALAGFLVVIMAVGSVVPWPGRIEGERLASFNWRMPLFAGLMILAGLLMAHELFPF